MDNIHDVEWLRNVINEAISGYLNENKIKQEHRALTPDELLEYDIIALDCTKYDSQILAKSLARILYKLKEKGENESDFYCGITNDVVARKSSHESQDYDGKQIEWMVAFKCDSKKTAAEVEEFMNTIWGVSRGKTSTFANGTAPDSDYVYFYRIPR